MVNIYGLHVGEYTSPMDSMAPIYAFYDVHMTYSQISKSSLRS